MDPLFFRGLTAALADILPGSRVGKAYEPAPGAFCLELSSPLGFVLDPKRAPTKKAYLLWIARPGVGFVFVSADKPGAPATPSGKAMWLRSRLSDRFILGVFADAPSRCLALELSMPGERPGRYLLLHLKSEPELVESLPDGFGQISPLPTLDDILASPKPWLLHPFLGKALAARLTALPRDEAESELSMLAKADGVNTYYGSLDAKGFARVLAYETADTTVERFETPVAAAAWLGPKRMDAVVSTHREADARDLERKAAAKKKRVQQALEADEARLTALVDSHRLGETLAAHLADLGPKNHLRPMDLVHPDGETLRIPLDPALTVAANMDRLFRLAAKGRRGLTHVKRRREELGAAALAVPAETAKDAPKQAKAQAYMATARAPKGIAARVFVTDDGLTVWRGKNAKANHDLLTKAAAPSDLWFHAEDGPGAHVILRLAGRLDAPKKSLEQAAMLAALASWQKNEGKGRVMVAKVSKVRTIKGAAMGQVAVDSVLTSLIVALDTDLENRLAVDGEAVDTGTRRG